MHFFIHHSLFENSDSSNGELKVLWKNRTLEGCKTQHFNNASFNILKDLI